MPEIPATESSPEYTGHTILGETLVAIPMRKTAFRLDLRQSLPRAFPARNASEVPTLQNVIQLLDSLQDDTDIIGGQPTVEMIDRGIDQGIDIRIHDPSSRVLAFEIVVLDSESCPLIGQSPQTSGSFRAFCRALSSIRASNCVLIRFRSRHVRKRGASDSRYDRNNKLLKMAEDIADEILTHRLGSMVEIAMQEIDGTTTLLA